MWRWLPGGALAHHPSRAAIQNRPHASASTTSTPRPTFDLAFRPANPSTATAATSVTHNSGLPFANRSPGVSTPQTIQHDVPPTNAPSNANRTRIRASCSGTRAWWCAGPVAHLVVFVDRLGSFAVGFPAFFRHPVGLRSDRLELHLGDLVLARPFCRAQRD